MKNIIVMILVIIPTMVLAQDFEGFETGDFSAYEWELGGNANWFVTNSNPHGGSYCAQGGDIGDSQTTTLEITRDITDNGTISFYWKVNSESNWDYLKFYLDGTFIQEISGTVGWTQVTINVSAGLRTFKWEYYKDGSITTGADTGWIDDITFPPTITYDNDLAGQNISGATVINAGNTENYEISIKNVGNSSQDSYTVRLMKSNGEELSSIQINATIEPDEIVEHTLTWNVPANEPQGITGIYGIVELEGDENPANDATETLQVQVFPTGIMEISIGNGTITDVRNPVCFEYKNSLSECLYFADEIGISEGFITSVTYQNNFSTNLYNKPTNVWIGETTLTNLTDIWIPATQLTQVFSGTVNYPSGQNNITIDFAQQYYYQGSNLVIMVHRPMEEQTFGSTDYFFHSTTPEHLDRTKYERDDTEVLDPYNPPVGWGYESFPNITISFFQGPMGNVEGYVIDDNGIPISGAEVIIEENQMVNQTDDQGYYFFGNVAVGNYNLTASKFGYSPQTNIGEVLDGQTIQIDFELIPLGFVIVTGHVVGSDFPNVGLDGAEISISGFANYDVVTNENGDFIVEEIYTNITYEINIIYNGYDAYTDELTVGSVNLDIGTVILSESTLPPGNIIAIQNEEGTLVDLNWNSPGQGGGEFRYDDGLQVFQIGLGDPVPNAVFGSIHPYISIINEVSWYLTSEFADHTQVKIIIFSLDYYNIPDRDEVLYISGFIPNVDDEWNTYELPEEVEAFSGFFVGVITPNQYTSIGLDDGEGEPWIFQSGTQLSIENWMDEDDEWIDIGDISSMFQKNMMIRALGINLGNTSSQNFVEHGLKADSWNDNNREFEGYNVYRFFEYEQMNPENWDLIASAIEDSSYTDTSWDELPNGDFQFAVLALHTNGIESIPAFSQIISRTTSDIEPEVVKVVKTALHGNYPNPFNPSTIISFSLTAQDVKNAKLEIYNLKGQKVKTFTDFQITQSSNQQITWKGDDENGNSVASGIYLYKLKYGSYTSTKKMILMK